MKALEQISGWLWSTPMVLLVLGIGTVFTVWMRVPQIRRIPDMIRQLKGGGGSERGISSFESLAMALGGRIGVGNIAGVAVAIGLGGPGAMFWMWVTAIIGAAVAIVESSLAQVWKEEVGGEYRGGPAYYIEKGLGLKWLALAYAVATIFATTMTGPAIQANSIAVSANEAFGFDPRLTGLFVAALFCLVVFGGMKRIGRVCGLVVPFMAIAYILMGIVVLVSNAEHVPNMFRLIFASAFGADSMFGGMLGAAVLWGVRRAIYSSEAGTGSGAQASAAAEVSHPVKQGLAQGFSVYIDTLFVCTVTGLMILSTNSYNVITDDDVTIIQYLPGVDAGPAFTQRAVETVAPGFGAVFIAIAMFFFAFTTLLSFGFYADTNIAYILRSNRHERTVIRVFQIVLAASILLGSFRKSDFAWALADVGLGLYAWINLLALIPLVPIAIRLFRDYERQRKAGIDPVFRPGNIGVADASLWDDIADHYERTGEALPASTATREDRRR